MNTMAMSVDRKSEKTKVMAKPLVDCWERACSVAAKKNAVSGAEEFRASIRPRTWVVLVTRRA
jgi:hypothetical protein